MFQNYSGAVLSILNVTTSRQTMIKFSETIFSGIFVSCLQSHWPTYACTSEACEQSKQSADWSRARPAIGHGTARVTRKIEQVR